MGGEYDVVVAGGGSAGCALAGRLATAGAGRVLLLEAGPLSWTPEVLDVASFAATAPGHCMNWAHPVELRTGTVASIPRGRVLGGSGAVNGAVWMCATPADGWGAPGWTWPDMLARYTRSEADADFDDRAGHGCAGPVPVSWPAGPLCHAATERFLVAAVSCGFPPEPDKNAGGPPGAGPVPGNSVDGVRVNPALAYLREALDREAGRAVGCGQGDGAPAAGVRELAHPYAYLRTEHDRRRLRHAVRTAAGLLRAGLGTRVEPGGAVLGSDRALDGWIAAHLTTAQHLCGTAAMGPDAIDPAAVVDPELRVHGLERLRVVDLSVLPVAPRRGTAATAVAVGEAGAEFLGARAAGTAG